MITRVKSNATDNITRNNNTIRIILLICAISLLLIGCNALTPTPCGIIGQDSVSVYEKLADGKPVNLLIVGDSIAQGTGSTKGNSWAAKLPEYIELTYGSSCTLTNISMGGNTSIAGVMREKMLDDGIDYDLIIICYGENDRDDEYFASNYEAIIRTSKSKYPHGNIICVLESSQREYTNKMNIIKDIAEFYDIPIADTINSYNTSGYTYEELVNAPDDMTHPNDKGHAIYLTTIADVIKSQINSNFIFDDSTHKFDNTICYSKSDFKKTGNNKYSLRIATPITANLTIYRSYFPGENDLKIYSDDSLIYESNFEWTFGFSQEHIDKLTNEPVTINNNLIIEFSSKEAAESFGGVMLNDIH